MTKGNSVNLPGACGIAAVAVAFACGGSSSGGGSVTGGSAGTATSGAGNAGQSNAGTTSSAGGALSGSGGSTAATGGYDNGSSGSIACDNADTIAAAFVEANQACGTAADCVEVNADCYSQQQDCCVVYLNRDYDEAAWSALISQLESCNEGCSCCAAIPAPPGCSAGRCGPDRG